MGYADSQMCQYCGDVVGDLHHRFWKCPRCADTRAAAMDDLIVDMASEASRMTPSTPGRCFLG
eukprot:7374098-Pyramimonas_sp.AAC.1